MKKGQELLFFTANTAMPYSWSVGPEGSRFLTEIRDNKKFVGIRCSRCGRVYVPPRKVCGPCFTPMDQWVDLGDMGTLEAFSVVNYSFIDPNAGVLRPVPYTYGYIRLDGADTMISHVLEETDVSKLKPGMRVKAIFNEERTGSLTDISFFRVV